MDASALDLTTDSFDAALSNLGIVLLPDPRLALKEALRVLKPGGRLGLVTWTRPEQYELAVRLSRAAEAFGWQRNPAAPLPAQLRYADPAIFRDLVEGCGFLVRDVREITEQLGVPGAGWLADHLGFAPGLDAMVEGFGDLKSKIVDRFAQDLVHDKGEGPVELRAVAHFVVAEKPL